MTAATTGTVLTIQYLRGVAAWAVVFHHFMQVFFDFESASFIGWLFAAHGRLGVDLFFIISGFVMHHTLSAKPYSAGGFMWRRLLRIAPAYWIATLVLVAAAPLGIVAADYKFALWDLRTLLLSFAFVPHEHLSGLGVLPVLTVGWTLNFEMFFYVTLAACLLIFGRFAFPAAIVLLGALPFVASPTWPWGPIMSSTLLYEFIIGIGLSMLYQRRLFFIPPVGLGALAGLGLAALAGAYLLAWGPYVHFVVPTLVVIAALLAERWCRGKTGVVSGVFRTAGDWSYSAYLYHPLALFGLYTAFGTPQGQGLTLALLAATVVITCILSWISYRFVEQGFGRWISARVRPT